MGVLERFSSCFFHILALTTFTLIMRILKTQLSSVLPLKDGKLTDLLLIGMQLSSLLFSQPLEEVLSPYIPSFSLP